jgi:hypothetical protein
MPRTIKALNPLELAKQALLPSQDDDEEQRVLQLFRNRAELKKAYTELQDEIHRLKDRLKQQEGATARMRELLEQLEQRLGSVDTGFPALVFYQLRSLWSQGSDLLRAFSTDLERQHLERERRAFLAEVNRRQFARREETQARLREAESAAVDAAAAAAELARRLAALNRPWHHFKRRDLQRELELAKVGVSSADAALADARAELERVLGEGDVPFPGLSVGARRAVNLSVIAYAEILMQRLAKTPLLALARAAVLRREPSDEYGSRVECEALMAQIGLARGVLAQRSNLGQEIRARVEHLQRAVAWRGDDDAVPVPESIPDFAEAERAPKAARTVAPAAAAPARSLNVLGDDVWDVFRSLLR